MGEQKNTCNQPFMKEPDTDPDKSLQFICATCALCMGYVYWKVTTKSSIHRWHSIHMATFQKLLQSRNPARNLPKSSNRSKPRTITTAPKLSKYVWNLPDFWEPLKYFQNLAIRLQFFQTYHTPSTTQFVAAFLRRQAPIQATEGGKNISSKSYHVKVLAVSYHHLGFQCTLNISWIKKNIQQESPPGILHLW